MFRDAPASSLQYRSRYMTDGDGCQRDNAKSNHPGKISPTSLIHHVVRFFSPRKNFSYFFFFVSFFLSQWWWWWWRSVMVVALSPLLIFRIYLMILIMFCVCVCSCFRVFFYLVQRPRRTKWRLSAHNLTRPSILTTGTELLRDTITPDHILHRHWLYMKFLFFFETRSLHKT